MTEPLIIGPVSAKAERRRVLAFIRTQYLIHFNTTPPVAEHLFAAWKGTTIVGTMGLDVGTEKRPVQLERMYHCPVLPLPAKTTDSVQFGRWVVTHPLASGPLTYIACCRGIDLGKHYGWCEHTASVHRVALRFGICFHPVVGATLILAEVTPRNREFYCSGTPMHLYLVELEQARQALDPRIRALVQSGRIELRARR